jgi:biopolymer transport protein ExbD
MAAIEEQTKTRRKIKSTPKQKKKSSKVDLTPMVDLGFLLITFFMVTTAWSQPRAMKIFLPAKGPVTTSGESTTLTIIPLSGNRVFYYEGSLTAAMQTKRMGRVDFSFQTGIGNVIRQKQLALDRNKKYQDGRRELVIMIKPAAEASYQTVISSLDEMSINDVRRYALVELGEDEKKWISQMKLN